MKILLVEDDKASRNSLSEFLENFGHKVLNCPDGLEAVEILKKQKINLIISDIRMPGLNGYELLKYVKEKEELKDTIVVLITGQGDIRGAIDAMKTGAYDYLLKPINVRELSAIVDKINEFIELKKEHFILKRNFNKQLDKATKELKLELNNLKETFTREIGISGMGIFSDMLLSVFKSAGRLHLNPDIPVLIEGETGTGKELIAKYIHYGRGENISQFIALNCASISASLFESELFGYEPGAFTGGNPKGQIGKLELAKGGSIFLDEITEMPVEHQAKLLRVIQEREYYKIGGLKKLHTDARIICATNQDVNKKISEGVFRQDLFYRLSVGHIKIPPLRERPDEIIPLANMFLNRLKEHKQTKFVEISNESKNILRNYSWPGNVRELKNTIERIVLHWDEEEIKPYHLESLLYKVSSDMVSHFNSPEKLSLNSFSLPEDGFDLNDWNLEIVKKILTKTKWNKTRAAKYLGISRTVLNTYVKRIENQ